MVVICKYNALQGMVKDMLLKPSVFKTYVYRLANKIR